MLKIFLCSFALLLGTEQYAQLQDQIIFGELTAQDKDFSDYPADPEAAAIVLYSGGKVSVEVIDNSYIRLVKEVHKKIKVLDPERFEGGTVEITYFKGQKVGENIKYIKALTHNQNTKVYVANKEVYTKNYSDNYFLETFTFPDIQKGSILEYTYRIESPYFNTFKWEFQNDYPTLRSEFVSSMPGNYLYRIALFGTQKLVDHDVAIKDNCFSVDGFGDAADCAYEHYVMENIPAFKEEDFMLAKDNYVSKVKYELKESSNFAGARTKHAKQWRDVDREFRTDKEMGRQLKNKSFFEKQLPGHIFAISQPLEKAKAAYYFIQDHYTWDGNYRIFNNIDVKKAFEDKSGNIAEINLSLINALRALDIDAELVLSATRDAGIPTQIFPVLTDFNYVMTLVTIEGKEYYLDATDSYTPFSFLPFRALNSKARVMDFKEGSYWHSILPNKKNVHFLNASLALDNEGTVSGTVKENHMGYVSVKKRRNMDLSSKEDYLSKKETKDALFEITSYQSQHRKDLKEDLIETYTVTYEPELVGDELYISPFFLFEHLTENPFKLEERDYPVEMGYPINFTYMSAIKVDPLYETKSLPENRIVKLPENTGTCSVFYKQSNNTITLRFNFKLNEYQFESNYYEALKDFFSKSVSIISKDLIVIKKS